MKLKLNLGAEERRTLREMGIYHPHARIRMRAQGMFRLAQGLTLQQVADEFEVHLNSVEKWRQRWDELGLVGLFEGRHTGLPPELSDEERRCVSGSFAASQSWRRFSGIPELNNRRSLNGPTSNALLP